LEAHGFKAMVEAIRVAQLEKLDTYIAAKRRAERLKREALSLPCFVGLLFEEQKNVISHISQI
jgi:dTDP-4-amino-4,6-dideoxygalactose transaminase